MLQCVGVFTWRYFTSLKLEVWGICFLSLFFKSINQVLSVKNDTTQFMGTVGKAIKLFYLTMDCILAFIRVCPEIVLI